MNGNITYSSDLQNGIRLSCLLIEVGTTTVRKIFDNNVLCHSCSLIELLKKSKKCMSDHLKPQKGKPRLLTNEQYCLMYPKNGVATSEKFDLTLLLRLIDILCCTPPPPSTQDWRPLPPDTDGTLSANLVRIRFQRNRIYGHIASMKLTKDQFEDCWKALSDILLELGSDQCDIDKYKTQNLDPETQRNYKDTIEHLVSEDICSLESVLVKMSKADIKQEKTLEYIELLMTEMERLKTCIPTEIGFSTCRIMELFQTFPEKDVIQKSFCTMEANILKKLTDVESSINTNISRQVQHVECTINANISTQMKHLSGKMQELKEHHLQSTKSKPESTASIDELVETIKMLKEAIKVLILDTPSEDISKEELNELGRSIGHIPWDIVLDLNHESRISGMYDSILECLNEQKGVKTITYKGTKNVTEHEKELIASDKKALWVLSNGCKEVECEPVSKIAKATVPLTTVLMGILENISPKPMLVVNTCFSEKQCEFSSAMGEMVIQVMEASDERVAIKKSKVLVLNIGNDCALEECYKKNGLDQVISFNLHLRELIDALGHVYPNETSQEKIYIPSKTHEIYITKKELVPFIPYMELFHKDIGKPHYGPHESPESFSKKTRLQYHKGGMLTAECLYLNGKFPLYVRRTEIEQIKRRIEKRLESSRWSELTRDFFIVSHDASGGGSTVVRAVLYELRDRYPCIIIKQLSEALYDGLLLIYKKSRLTLLILIDELETGHRERTLFMRQLENTGIKAQVLLTDRITLSNIRDMNYQQDQPYVSSNLTPEDAAGFKDLFSQHDRQIRQSGRVFLYGLQAFLGESKRLSAQIQFVSRNTTKQQQLLLRICCLMWKYGNFAISMTIAMKILDASPDDMVEENIFTTLGYASDLLVRNGNGLKPAHACIIEPLMCAQCETQNPRSHLLKFIGDVKEVIKLCSKDPDAVGEMCFHVFAKRKRIFYHRWTQLVEEMDEILHHKETSRVLQELADTLIDESQEPHMRALLARYLMYKAHDSKGAIAEIRKACRIDEGESIVDSKVTYSNLLSTYGNIYREMVRHIKPKYYGKGGSTEEYMELVRIHTEEAVKAYKMAQGCTHSGDSTPRRKKQKGYSAVPFIGEAKARSNLLKIYLEHTFEGNVKDFWDFVSRTKDDFVRCSEQEAYDAINKMEYLQLLDKLDDEAPEETWKSVLEVKLDLLYTHTESSQRTASMISQITSFSKDSSIDIGYLVRMHGKEKKCRYWETLSVKELKFIVDELQTRLPRNPLRSNFDSIIMAMIHLRYKQRTEKYTLKFALECAKQWIAKFDEDYEAYFMYGILHFVLAYEDKSSAIMVEAKSYLNTCREICKRIKTTSSYRYIRFYIGKGNGLGRVIPRYASANDSGELETFDGRQVSKDTVIVRPFKDVKAKIMTPESLKHIADQERLLQFNLAFAHDTIYACNIQMNEFEP